LRDLSDGLVALLRDDVEVGGQKCMISILRDMTEQKSLEKQLRQSQKMEAIG